MRGALLAIVLTGCIQANAVTCGDGRICPAGTHCGAASCVPDTCDSGTIEGAESCDGAELGSADCTSFGFYGTDGLACTDACELDTSACTGGTCGDNLVQLGFETCDGAFSSGRCEDYGFEIGRVWCDGSCHDSLEACERVGWTPMQSGTAASFTSVWARTATDAYVVGTDGAVRHFDGASWGPVTDGLTDPLNAVSGSPDGALVLAVGENGTVLRRAADGSWAAAPATGIPSTANARAVWVSSATRARVAAGTPSEGATVYAFDGAAWSALPDPHLASIFAVYDNGTATYVAGGDAGGANQQVRVLDGATWTTVIDGGLGASRFRALWGTPAGDVVYVAGVGGTVCRIANRTAITCGVLPVDRLLGATGTGPVDAFVVGSDGTIFRTFDGARWEIALTGTADNLNGAFALDSGTAFAVGDNGRILRFSGVSRDGAVVLAGTWTGLWADSASDAVYATGIAALSGASTDGPRAKWTAATRTWTTDLVGGQPNVNAIDGANGRIVAVGEAGKIWKDGAATMVDTTVGPSVTLRDVWASPQGTVFAVGRNAEAMGGPVIFGSTSVGAWSSMVVPAGLARTTALEGVGGASDHDVYAVGEDGTILHFDGTSWTALAAPTARHLYDVWSDGSTTIVVGAGQILHRRGDGWVAIPVQSTLHRIWALDASDVFAVGEAGAVLHFDGVAWSTFATSTSSAFYAVTGTRRQVVIGGELAKLVRVDRTADHESACADQWDNDGDGKTNCGDADCASDARCTAGGACYGAIVARCGTTHGTTRGGPARIDLLPCATRPTPGTERYYKFVADTAGPVRAHLAAANPAVTISVVGAEPSGACAPVDRCLASGGDAVFEAEAGATYFVIVDSDQGLPVEHDLVIDCP